VFVEEPGRFGGCALRDGGSQLNAGDRVSMTGKVATRNGERVIEGASLTDFTGGEALARSDSGERPQRAET